MATTLNGQALFDERSVEIEVGSLSRELIDRSVAGLDGVISIDLGLRGRVIRQKGILRARSKAELIDKIGSIRDYMDGYVYTLIANSGERFDDVRIDAFKTTNERPSGTGMAVDYEINYTQLSV